MISPGFQITCWRTQHPAQNQVTCQKSRFRSPLAVWVISVVKIEGPQHRPKVVFCAFMQAQFAAVTPALAKGSRASLGAPFTQLWPTAKATSMPTEVWGILQTRGHYSAHTTSTALRLVLKAGELKFCRASINHPPANTEHGQHSRLTPILSTASQLYKSAGFKPAHNRFLTCPSESRQCSWLPHFCACGSSVPSRLQSSSITSLEKSHCEYLSDVYCKSPASL